MGSIIPALIAKRLRPKAKLIIRTGYTQSLFNKLASRDYSESLKLERHAYQKCDLALVTSKGDQDYIMATHKIPANKIQVVANYIDTNLFCPISTSKYPDRLVFVGRAGDPQKNIPALLNALAGANLKLDIIGRPKNIANLEHQAKKQKIPLNFLGIIPNQNLPATLNKYPIFILPSLYEGMPKSLLEAMACGLACIATDVPGSREVIQNGVNGLLTKTNSDSLKLAILKLKNDPALRQKLGQTARAFVVQNFSLQTQINKEISAYQNLI